IAIEQLVLLTRLRAERDIARRREQLCPKSGERHVVAVVDDDAPIPAAGLRKAYVERRPRARISVDIALTRLIPRLPVVADEHVARWVKGRGRGRRAHRRSGYVAGSEVGRQPGLMRWGFRIVLQRTADRPQLRIGRHVVGDTQTGDRDAFGGMQDA